MKDQSLMRTKGKRAVLLFHSFTGKPKEFKRLAARLAEKDFTVYAPLLSRHGTSDLNQFLDADVEAWFQEGLAAYDDLQAKGYRDIAVFGLSMGGMIATYVAIHRPVVACGTFSSPMSGQYPTAMVEVFSKRYALHQEKDIQSLQTVKDKLSTVLERLNDEVLAMQPAIETMECPVLIVQGLADQMIHPKEWECFKERLQLAPTTVHLYEKAPHILTIGRPGVQLSHDLITFLEKAYKKGVNI